MKRKKYLFMVAAPLLVTVLVATTLAASPVRRALFDSQPVPATMTYQGYLTDAQGNPVRDGRYQMEFNIYKIATRGQSLWGDSHQVSVVDGSFTVELGTGTVPGSGPAKPFVFRRSLKSVLADGDAFYLGITVDGGTEMTPRQKLTSSPFAIRAADADTLDGLDSSAFALAGESGSSTTGADSGCEWQINVGRILEALEVSPDCLPTVTESPGGASVDPVVAVRADGRPVIAYAASELKVALCADIQCSSMTEQTVPGTTFVSQRLSIAVDSTNNPVITYYDASNTSLNIAACTNETCSAANVTLIDGQGTDVDAGRHSAVALNRGGLPIIAYYALSGGEGALKVASCATRNCSSKSIIEVQSSGGSGGPVFFGFGAGQAPSIALRPDGRPVIAYVWAFNERVMVAMCDNPACSSAETQQVAIKSGVRATDVVVPPDDRPVILYTGYENIYTTRCPDTVCTFPPFGSNSLRKTVGSGINGAMSPYDPSRKTTSFDISGASFELTEEQRPFITLNIEDVGMMVWQCDDLDCENPGLFTRVARTEGVPHTPHVAVSPDGTPVITYAYLSVPRVIVCDGCTEW